MKLIINKCNHGFTLSQRQMALFPNVAPSEVDRSDPMLVKSFEDGDQRGDGGSTLRLVEIPDGSFYKISENDGIETLYWSASEVNSI